MEQQTPNTSVALIVGVTGMVGLALASALKSPSALGGPYKVYGSARRPKPTWFPPTILDGYIPFDAADLNDTRNKLFRISTEVTHVFWVALQVRQNEEENIRVNKLMLTNVLSVLKSSPTSSLRHIAIQTGTQQYMGPVHDPTKLSQLVPHEPPFHEDLPRLPYPNFYYPLEDLVASYASYAPTITHSIHRSSIIIGASSRSVYNMLLSLAVYATICRHEGFPFRYPGTRYTWDHFCDMSDARVLAEQQIWASVTPKAHNQAFNCTNGDVFTWKSLWMVLCQCFDVEFVPFHESNPFDFVGMMEGKGQVWDDIVEKHELYKTKLEEITCFAGVQHVLDFKLQHVCDMNKSKEFGFFGYANTLKSIPFWVAKLREMKLVP